MSGVEVELSVEQDVDVHVVREQEFDIEVGKIIYIDGQSPTLFDISADERLVLEHLLDNG